MYYNLFEALTKDRIPIFESFIDMEGFKNAHDNINYLY